MPIKFGWNWPGDSAEEDENVKSFKWQRRLQRRQIVIRKAHLSLWLRWAKKILMWHLLCCPYTLQLNPTHYFKKILDLSEQFRYSSLNKECLPSISLVHKDLFDTVMWYTYNNNFKYITKNNSKYGYLITFKLNMLVPSKNSEVQIDRTIGSRKE